MKIEIRFKKWILALTSIFAIGIIALSTMLLPSVQVKTTNGALSLTVGMNQAQAADTSYLAEHAEGYYYLSAFTGIGTEDRPYKPLIADYTKDFPQYIDLRSDCTKVDGLALVFSPELVKIIPGIILLGNSLTSDIDTQSLISFKTQTSAVDITATKIPNIVAQLLVTPTKRAGLCPPVKPELDGKIRIYLGGQIYGPPPIEVTHSTITDNFNRDDADALGTSSEGWSWVEFTNDWDIVSNQARAMTASAGNEAYANSDLGSANMYAQVVLASYSGSAGAGVLVRKEASSTRTFYGAQGQWGSGITPNTVVRSFKRVAGSFTSLDDDTQSWGANYVIKAQIDGSTLTTWYNGVQCWTGTDTSIETGNYAGLTNYNSSGSYFNVDDFEASALEAGGDPSISNTPTSEAFGMVNPTTTYWAKNGLSAPSFPLTAGNCTFVVTNNGTITIDISANATNPTGGTGATLTSSSPGDDEIRVSLFKAGDGESDNLTLTLNQQAWVASLAASANVSWDIKMEIGTSTEIPATQKTFHIYLLAGAS